MNKTVRKVLSRITSLVPAILSLVAIGFLFAPLFTIEFKDKSVDPAVKWSITYNVIEFFKDFHPLHFTFILFLVLLVSGIVFSILYRRNKVFGFISVFSYVIGLCLFIMQGRLYEYNQVFAYNEANLEWGGIVVCILLAIASITEFVIAYQRDKMTIRDIAEDGMLIALALVLDFIKIPIGATGGSINLQMLPLFIIALRHGPLHGFIASGIVYGFVSCLVDMYPLTCYPFDYIIGFGGTAVIGVFNKVIVKNKTTYNVTGELFLFLGGVLATMIRWFGSSISSVINYNVTFVEGLAFNIIYILPSGLICVAILMVAYGPLLKFNNFANRRSTVRSEHEE